MSQGDMWQPVMVVPSYLAPIPCTGAGFGASPAGSCTQPVSSTDSSTGPSEVEKLEQELKELKKWQDAELRALKQQAKRLRALLMKYEVPLQEVEEAAAQEKEKRSRKQAVQLAGA